jgi:putative ABC transport system substrate-binding protein
MRLRKKRNPNGHAAPKTPAPKAPALDAPIVPIKNQRKERPIETANGTKQTSVCVASPSALEVNGASADLRGMSAFDPKRTLPFSIYWCDPYRPLGAAMRRRELITLLGSVAVIWPLAARAQQTGRLRRVGVLIPFPDDRGPQVKDYLSAFRQRLHELGWDEGRNIQFDYRFTDQVPERMRAGTEELIKSAPDIIVVWANPAAAIVQKATQTIPIVFVVVSDPVGGGFVTNLARPGGNITGFQNFETAIGGKWLQVLNEIAPGVRRVAFVHSPDIFAHVAFMHAAEAASISLGMTVTSVGVRSAAEIEPALRELAKEPDSALIVAPSPFNTTNQKLILALASELRLPAVYPFRYFAENGGLASYGFDTVEQHRGAASYVDRILKGEKPGDMPVQAPTKYQLVINLKTAKALGLNVPVHLQQIADEIIE